jgi:membrane-associated phospholipid phosphatase
MSKIERVGLAANFSSQDCISGKFCARKWSDASDLNFYLQGQRIFLRMVASQKWPWKFLLWLLAGAGIIALAFLLDNRVDGALSLANNDGWHKVAWWISKSAEGEIVGGAGIIFAAIFFFANYPRVAARFFFVMISALLIGLTETILRVLVGRTRPALHGPLNVPPGFYGVWHDGHWIIGKAAFSAFPSGHAAVAAGLAMATWLVHRGWGAAAWLYALAVMWSRLALQWHHFSDVVASAVLAIPLAMLSKTILLPSVEFQFGNLHRAWRKK